MPLLLLSLSLSKSSSDSTAEDPVEEMEELDSFLRRGPSTTSSQSSCCISREELPPSGVMVTCGTGRASITSGGPIAHDGAIWAAFWVRSSRIWDDLPTALRSKRDPSSGAVPESPKSLEVRLLHSLGIGDRNPSWERTTRGAKPIQFNRQIWSFHFQKRSWVFKKNFLVACYPNSHTLKSLRQPLCSVHTVGKGNPSVAMAWLALLRDYTHARRRTQVYMFIVFRVAFLASWLTI